MHSQQTPKGNGTDAMQISITRRICKSSLLFGRDFLYAYILVLPILYMAKYIAREHFGLGGVASASVVGMIAGLLLPSPYREIAYGAGFTSCSTNPTFTAEFEPVCAASFCLVFLLLRPILNGVGGKLGMMVYVAGHISASIMVFSAHGTWESVTIVPTTAFQDWSGIWFGSFTRVLVTIGLIIAAGISASATLWLHVHFKPTVFNPVVASSLISLIVALYVPWKAEMTFFVWTGAFVGMSSNVASPNCYSLIKFPSSVLWSDLISIFFSGVWSGIVLVLLWWMAPGIGGKYGFVAFVACFTVQLLTRLINHYTTKRSISQDSIPKDSNNLSPPDLEEGRSARQEALTSIQDREMFAIQQATAA